jgi:hypothetical protein
MNRELKFCPIALSPAGQSKVPAGQIRLFKLNTDPTPYVDSKYEINADERQSQMILLSYFEYIG